MKLEKDKTEELSELGFRVINLNSKIDLPEFSELAGKDWITYGPTNEFPQFLVDTYHMKSITHKTIINRKQKMIWGGGWTKSLDPFVKQFLDNPFSNDNLNDILRKISFDLEINGGFALNVIWSNDGSKIAQIDHIPFETVRVDKQNGKDLIDYYWISSDWSNTRKHKPEKYQGFSKKYKEVKSQILYITEYQPGSRMFYPIPMYYSSINWILAEWEISNFHRSSIQNGFNAGFLLNFATGVPSKDEIKRAYREIEAKYTGTFNAGKFILTFSNGVEQQPNLTPIPLQDTDARYTQLNDLIKQNIFTANEVTNPELFGVSIPGKLGSKSEMLEGLEIFQSTYINYKQEFIEGVFNKLGKINGLNEELKIEKYKLDFGRIEAVKEDVAEDFIKLDFNS
jgi:hypothetical protein